MRTLPPRRVARPALVLTALLAALACGETAPLSAPVAAAPRFVAPQSVTAWKSTHDERRRMPVLQRTRLLRHNEVACRAVGPESSSDVSITLRKAGLTVTFPAGSVTEPTAICLTAQAGSLLTYSFEPHGLQFARPIVVTQDLRNTTAWHDPSLGASLIAGYLEGGVDADVDASGVGQFAELFTTGVYDDAHRENRDAPSVATFETVHFSGYALASGKSDSTSLIKK